MMKEYQIEETIIAYFDGRLTDSEGAELLHRVSISPEIRQLFSEHEMLRNMAYRSVQNVSVRPELEDALFTSIAALQQEEKTAAVLPQASGFWSVRRISIAAAVVGLLLAGIGDSIELGANHTTNHIATQAHTNAQQPLASSNVISGNSALLPGNLVTPALPATTGKGSIHTNRANTLNLHAAVSKGLNAGIETSNLPLADTTALDRMIAMAPEPRITPVNNINRQQVGEPTRATLRDLFTANEPSRFEIGLMTSGGVFTRPADGISLNPFSAYHLQASYSLGEHDRVGVRAASEFLQYLQTSSNAGTGFTSVTGSMEQRRVLSYTLFYERVQEVNAGRFYVIGGVGAGLYSLGSLASAGNLVSAELGLRLPLSDRLFAGATIMVSRMHQNGLSKEELISSQPGPAIYSGQDIHNTLNEVFLYGLSYRF